MGGGSGLRFVLVLTGCQRLRPDRLRRVARRWSLRRTRRRPAGRPTGPWPTGRRTAGPRTAGPSATLAATGTTAATEATTAASAGGAGDLGGGASQRRADLVDLHLDDGPLLALTGLERPLLQATLGDHGRALGERLGHVLGGLAPRGAPHEQGLAVLPLVRLAIERARGRRDGEARHGSTRRGEAQLGVGGQVADDGDEGVAGHGQRTSGRMTLVRSTDSLRLSWRSSSLASSGVAFMSTTA